MSVCLFVCLSIRLFVRLSIRLFPLILFACFYLCVCLCVCSISHLQMLFSVKPLNSERIFETINILLLQRSQRGKNLLNMEILNHLNDCLVKSSRKNIQMSICYLYSPMDNTENLQIYTLVSLNDHPLGTLTYLGIKCYATSTILNST